MAVLLAGWLTGGGSIAVAETTTSACAATAPTPACGNTPSAQFDAQGRLWVVYEYADRVWLSRSRDFGNHFDTAVAVTAAAEPLYADGENRPVLALGDGGEVFVAWTRRNAGLYSGDIRFARSLDGGQHFSPPVTVNDDGLATSHRFVSMARTPAGQLYLSWLDKRDQVAAKAAGGRYDGAALYYAVSTDAGASFAPNRKVADQSCECCRVAMTVVGPDRMAVLWRQLFDDGAVRDHALAVLTPSAPPTVQRATDDHWVIEACPHHGPALAAATAGLHMVWFTNGDRQQGVVYGFFDSASGHASRVHVVDAQPGAGHPALSVQGERVSVVWKAFDGTHTRLQVQRSHDDGRHWQPADTLAVTAGASDHPQTLQYGEQRFVAWHTADEGYRVLPLLPASSGEHP